MSKKYKVIWFDDEHETLEALIDEALAQNVSLFGFSNSEDGLVELTKNIAFYDAVIVDGLFYKKKLQNGDAVNDDALFNVARTLDKLEAIKKIPWFIFSGQDSFTKERNRIAEEYKNNKVYDKNNDSEIEQLWLDIKSEADKQIDTQIRHKYQNVFDVCVDNYIGVHVAKDFLYLLNEDNHEFGDKLFNILRKIIEDIFLAFHKFELLPVEFVKPSIFLNESSKFLSGFTEKSYTINEESKLPKLISDNLRSVLSLTQSGSHRSKEGKLINDLGPSYFFQGAINQLLTIIIWFKKYIDSNPKTNNWIKSEISKWEKQINIFEGLIEQDEYGNYYCGDYLLNYRYTQENFNINDKIKIIQSDENTDIRNKRLYPFHAKRFAKLN